jgi:hypothetical protein
VHRLVEFQGARSSDVLKTIDSQAPVPEAEMDIDKDQAYVMRQKILANTLANPANPTN